VILHDKAEPDSSSDRRPGDSAASRGQPEGLLARPPSLSVERRGNIADRRGHMVDRRGRTDRRSLFADRRVALEARFRAPADTQLQTMLVACQETERRRIAADLHDSIGSSLCTARFKLEDAIGQIREQAPHVPLALLTEISADIGRTMEEVRRIAMDLRPSILDDLGIVATLGWLTRELGDSHKNIRVVKQVDVREQDVPRGLKTTIFRILQEALNNAIKHSEAGHLFVTLRQDAEELRLVIEDNGKGFDLSEARTRATISPCFGITSMHQRATSSGGSLAIRSSPGAGTTVCSSWPRVPR
jgi:signal transduction histidine kinase